MIVSARDVQHTLSVFLPWRRRTATGVSLFAMDTGERIDEETTVGEGKTYHSTEASLVRVPVAE